jgi:hypothetical protein
MTTTIYKRHIAEIEVAGKPLGRHVNWDSRSKNFPIPKKTSNPVSKKWTRHIGPLDQGNLGSCTGNASVGALATGPLFDAIQDLLKKGLTLDEALAVAIYSLGTQLDAYSGTYPPTDTGSDGLSVAKACLQKGYISGYTHALSLDDVIQGLQDGPLIVGTNWMSGMDSPNSAGLVYATGTVRGGHEYEALEVDIENRVFGFENSWGPNFGVGGRFYYSFDDMATLLKAEGDATKFTPLSAPAPTPVPGPTIDRTFSSADFALLDTWSKKPHVSRNNTQAAKAWKRGS